MSALSRVFKVARYAGIFATGCIVGSFATIRALSTAEVEHVHNGVIIKKEGDHLKYMFRFCEPGFFWRTRL